MSLEQEIGRLADVLEKIEAKMGGETVVKDTPPPVAKKKGKVAPANVVETETVVEESGTPEDFLKYCNTTLLGITDVTVRAAKIGKIKDMLMKEYKAASIKAVPVESIAECKIKFDTIVGV